MGGFSIWHILIFAILVLLLFGGSRFSNMMGDVAKGLKSFKQGLSDDEDEKKRQQQLPPQQQAPQQPIDVTPRPADPVAPPPSSSTPDDLNR
jgi:sec-independent protein translocase protein TatA